MYFLQLHSVVIIYEWPPVSEVNHIYLESLKEPLKKIPPTSPLILNWIRVSTNETQFTEFLQKNEDLGAQVTVACKLNIIFDYIYTFFDLIGIRHHNE